LDLIGFSLLEMVRGFERVCGTLVPFKVGPRRSGDIAA
jgi:UDP-glucose 4-epimerase